MSKLIAFHGDPKIKEFYLARVRAHREADEIVHGTYWEKGKGCAVGCTIHSGRHADYETEMGIPRQLARLEDGIFEGMPNGNSKEWPEAFLNAIPVGADLYPAYWRFMHWLLVDPVDGVLRFAKTDQQRNAIQSAGGLYLRQIDGGTVTEKEWHAAADAAYAAYAAAYAADAAAAYAAAAAAAYAAAAAAADAAAAAAAAAADAAYAAAARITARVKQSEALLRFLAAATPSAEAT